MAELKGITSGKQIKIGEFYRLRSSPNYGWAKAVRVLKPGEGPNTSSRIAVECQHTVGKSDEMGFIRLFHLHSLLRVATQ